MSSPSVFGPPCSTCAAMAGINTVYGVPAMLMVATSSRAERIGTECSTYFQPWCNSSSRCISAASCRTRGATRIARIEPITATYEMASMPKHQPSPKAAINRPPIDGPIIRVPLTIDEFSAMAFGRSRRSSTISLTNAWRAGVSNELMMP